MAVIVFMGFAPTYYLRAGSQPALSTLLSVHGAFFTSWIVILIVQTSFIAANRRDLHKRVGIAAFVVGATMVVLGVTAAIDALRRGTAPLPGVDPRTFLIIPLGDMLLFASFLGAGFYFRRRTETHKRLLVAIAAAYDFATRRRVHQVYLWGALAIAVSVPLRLAIGGSAPWLAFADSLLR